MAMEAEKESLRPLISDKTVLQEEYQEECHPHYGTGSSPRGVRRLLSSKYGAAFIVSVVALSALLNILLACYIAWRPYWNNISLGEEINGLYSTVPLDIVTFHDEEQFTPTSDPTMSYEQRMAIAQKSWMSLIPESYGFFFVESHEDYMLPRPMVNPDLNRTNIYGPSVYHQIHCLYHLFTTWMAYEYNQPPPSKERAVHIPHCFNYLRQSLMCFGDTTLEGGEADDPTVTLGTGAHHICKNYDALFQQATRKGELFDELRGDQEWHDG